MKKIANEPVVSITVKVPISLKKEWEEYANEIGSNSSTYLRMMLVKELEEYKKTKREDQLGLLKK